MLRSYSWSDAGNSYFDFSPSTTKPPNTLGGYSHVHRSSFDDVLPTGASFPLVPPMPGTRRGDNRASFRAANRPAYPKTETSFPQLERVQGQGQLCCDASGCSHGLDIEACSPQACFSRHSPTDTDMFATHLASSNNGSTPSSLSSPAVPVQPKLDRRDSGQADVTLEAAAAVTATRTASSRPNKDSRSVRGRRVPHHLVERRYRENLNGQIEALRLSLPALRDDTAYGGDIEDPAEPVRMPSKTAIITAAVEHIAEMHAVEGRWQESITALQTQVAGLQKLVHCGDCSILQYLQSLDLGNGQAVSA